MGNPRRLLFCRSILSVDHRQSKAHQIRLMSAARRMKHKTGSTTTVRAFCGTRPSTTMITPQHVMQYTLLPATPADLPDIIAIYHAAFSTYPFIGQLMPNVPPEVRQAHDMHWYGREFELSELNGLRFRKVVDENGYGRSLSRPHFLLSLSGL